MHSIRELGSLSEKEWTVQSSKSEAPLPIGTISDVTLNRIISNQPVLQSQQTGETAFIFSMFGFVITLNFLSKSHFVNVSHNKMCYR